MRSQLQHQYMPTPSPTTATHIIDLGALDAEQAREQLGSKEKFWVDIEIDGETATWLFKQSKRFESTGQVIGDHWSEHLASRLMRCAGVPAHVTRLARDAQGCWGVLCRNVLRSQTEQLVHGVELLIRRASAHGKVYRAEMNYPTGYDVGRVYRTLHELCGDDGAQHFADMLLLDTWLRNADRHDENWGIIRVAGGAARPCPAYDNASCLGRTLTPSYMQDLLDGRRHGLDAFLARGKSAFTHPDTGRRLTHEEALLLLAQEHGAREWLRRRLDIVAGMHERAAAEVEAVLGAAGCGDTEVRFVLTLLDQSLQRITRCIA
ncbi:MAG: hypothetical protein EA398_00885 [Deltaproteobacteria bacterium]|nr:MAG: hypothetical protein EA398_00885 [Deltaproteobacteria bacterium]